MIEARLNDLCSGHSLNSNTSCFFINHFPHFKQGKVHLETESDHSCGTNNNRLLQLYSLTASFVVPPKSPA